MFPVLFMNSIKLCNVVDLSQGHKTVAYTGTLYLAAPSSHYVSLSLFSLKKKNQKKRKTSSSVCVVSCANLVAFVFSREDIFLLVRQQQTNYRSRQMVFCQKPLTQPMYLSGSAQWPFILPVSHWIEIDQKQQ